MNRTGLQKLARIRAAEASALLRLPHYSGAFYLSGYSVECGLKACIAKMTQRHDFPDKDRVHSSYTHNLLNLLRLAELQSAMAEDSAAIPVLAANWATVQRWSEKDRYSVKSHTDAQDMIRSVTGRGGVLPWIAQRW
jgi:hypothetical protein